MPNADLECKASGSPELGKRMRRVAHMLEVETPPTPLPDFRRGAIIAAACAATWLSAHNVFAATSDYAVPVNVTVSESPAQMNLIWPAYSTATRYEVYRKSYGGSSWSNLVTISNSTGTVTNWTDTNVTAGAVYEYQVKRTAGVVGYGFTMSSIHRPLADDRGAVILIVDNSKASALSNELVRLHKDLIGDGWTVLRHDVTPAHWNSESWKAAVTNVKAIIKADYDADTNRVKAVFLIGHVPVPYSGNIVPDGHNPEHSGAWPADVYYGDMTGTWTDNTVSNVTASSARNRNTPGDGKFDQYSVPATPVLQVGRVDFYDMTSFSKTDTELLRQYLDKDHNYRTGIVTLQPRGLVDDNFGDMSGEAFAYDGWRNFGVMLGATNVAALDFFTTLATESYLWAYGCGGGGTTSASGVGTSSDFDACDPKVAFTMLFGSWFGDWDQTDDFMRACLGSATYTLSCSWAGRPDHYYHFMALGETIGECMRRTQCSTTSLFPAVFEWYRQYCHVALLGDPTLRQHLLPVPTGFSGTNVSGTTVLSWQSTPDPTVLGYNVFRSSSYTGSFTRLNVTLITDTNYTEYAAPTGSMVYLVRPVALTVSRTGSYTNIGQGAFLEINNATSSGSFDSDSDGCPDFWEVLYGMNPASSVDATNDIDKDGLSAVAEYRAGTNPTNEASVFRILRFDVFTGSNLVWWYGTTNSGVTNGFTIELRTNLLTGSWTNAVTNLVRSASGTNVWSHTNPPVEQPVLYRIAIP